MTGDAPSPPLVAHLVHRLAQGGLESGLAMLINNTPKGRYRHAVICLTEATDFARRIRPGTPIAALGEKHGFQPGTYVRLTRIFRRLKPAIVHTRNLGCVEGQLCAVLAGVPVRIHGEHGRDVFDPYGLNRKYNLLRKFLRPFTHHFTAVSQDLARWLVNGIGVPPEKVTQIYNGVDTARFHPRQAERSLAGGPAGFEGGQVFVVGTVGRMHPIKNQTLLARAFLRLLEERPEERGRLRLVMAGDGPLREECRALLEAGGAAELAWLPGQVEEVPALLQGLDVFVLPSIAEGICNSVLEAMASGLPVVATRVGGNPELVEDGVTGMLVPAGDERAMAAAIGRYLEDDELRRQHGQAGRARAEASFSLTAMVEGYLHVYDAALERLCRSSVGKS